MKILISGGAGQVGSHIAELLLARGDQVTVIDNLSTGRAVHLDEASGVDLRISSIHDAKSLQNLWGDNSGPDVIVHAAAAYSDANAWEEDVDTNVIGTLNLVRIAKQFNSRLIYFQTALCYGPSPKIQPVPLDYPREPAPSSYAISKSAGELYIEQSGIDYVTFRLANIVGPRNLSGPLPIFYKRLSEGVKCTIAEARRDFVDVRDLAQVVVQAVDGRGKGAYHFSSGSDISILELYTEVARALGFKENPEFDVPQTVTGNPTTILLDPSKTYADFSVPVLTPISETVEAAVSYYKKYGVIREVTHLKVASK